MLISAEMQQAHLQSQQTLSEEVKTPSALEVARLRKSKLAGTKSHLKALVEKKARLEIEIKGVLKSLQKQQKIQRKTLAEAFGLDPKDEDLENKLSQKINEDQELELELKAGDDLIRKISYLLEDSEFLVATEVNKLNDLLK